MAVSCICTFTWNFFFSHLLKSDLNYFSKFSHVKDIQAEAGELRDSSVG